MYKQSVDLMLVTLVFNSPQHFVICYCFFFTGLWRTATESSTKTLSFSRLQKGKELNTPYCPTPLFSPVSLPGSIELNANNGPSIVNNAIYWPSGPENQTESFLAGINDGQSVRKLESGIGCRLFGVQLLVESRAVEEIYPPTANSCVRQEQPVTAASLDAESDQQSEPSNFNKSDTPVVSSELEKSCLRSTYESQTRQLRSCTKVL